MRKALAIELLDVRTYVRVRDYEYGPRGYMQPAFTIDAADIVDVVRIFGINIEPDTAIRTYRDARGREMRVTADAVTLNIHPGDVENWECDDLEADPQGAGLLTFRVGWADESRDGGRIEFREYTYSGRYMVHWAEDVR
jgi:hypothetical protein